jgi:urate oxidase
MAVNRNTYTNTVTRNTQDKPYTYIKFFQLNLQHSRVATDNLVKPIAEQGTDYSFYKSHIQCKINSLVSVKDKIFTHGESRTRAAIVVNNNQIDTLLIKQLSVSDTVVLEVTLDS